MENPENQPTPKEEKTEEQEKMLDFLESAFEEGRLVELTVCVPSGELVNNNVFIEGLEGDTLFVSASKTSEVMGIKLSEVKSAKNGI